jgi:hypothetical protein
MRLGKFYSQSKSRRRREERTAHLTDDPDAIIRGGSSPMDAQEELI